MSHTRGPWNFHPYYNSYPGEVFRVGDEFDYLTIEIAKGETIIGQVTWNNANNGGYPSVATIEEARANAHVIVAASELYEVCKRIAEDPSSNLTLYDQQFLESVIAKAEGREVKE